MFSLPGVLGLIIFLYVRPQEYFTFLQKIPLLYIFLGLALFGIIIDIKIRLARPQTTQQLSWVVLFMVWCAITVGIRAPNAMASSIIEIGILLALYFVTAHSVQTFRGFHILATTVLVIVLFLTTVGIHQHFAPLGCVQLDPNTQLNTVVGTFDGRSCINAQACYSNNPEPGAEYECERIGLFGTNTVAGRVRYRGWLNDPNELALTISIGLPFAFGFYSLERKKRWLLFSVLITVAVLFCVKFTGSRGGLLVFAAVIGAYLVKRFRWKIILIGAIAFLPILAMVLRAQGRADASASSIERWGLLYDGMTMFRESPMIGWGFNQFSELNFLTAHNSYVLAPAELGLPGAFLWFGIIYVTIKGLLITLRRCKGKPEAKIGAVWAMTLLAALSGLLVGSFFLSFNYHMVFWVYIGLCGALFCAVKTHDPEWKIPFGVIDLGLLCSLTVGIISALYVFTRLKPPT
ncbi:MAG: O-antigen ligase family protein [Pseudomonadota bacterium]